MKSFKARVVAAWIVALPIAYAMVVQTQHRIDRFRTDPQGEVARQLQSAQHVSFVGFFVISFGLLVLLTLVIDELGALIQRLFPERAESPNPVA